MYTYHALINALSAHMIPINLNMIFYIQVENLNVDLNARVLCLFQNADSQFLIVSELCTNTLEMKAQRHFSRLHGGRIKHDLNPFTATLAAPSLEKRPIKMPNLKPLRQFAPFAWARERTSAKTHRIERFVLGLSSILFAGVYVCTFQPGNFTGWGSEGVNSAVT